MSLRRSTRAGSAAVRSKYFQKNPTTHQPVSIKKEDEDGDHIAQHTPRTTSKIKEEYPQEVKLEIIDIKSEELQERPIPEDFTEPEPKRRKKAPSVKIEGAPKPIPSNFQGIYDRIKALRSKIVTPVDTMGCANIPKTISGEDELTQKNYRFQLLVSLMLSSQTKDEVNFKAMEKMRDYFKAHGFTDGITLKSMLFIDEKVLDGLIFSVGFHTRKASYLKKSAEILRDQFDGDIPSTLEGLVSLPGVGPKMAFLTLQEGWNLNLGIGVDTHVHRLSKMWGWVKKDAKDPEVTRVELERWLPKEYWREINPMLVGFGQTICLPRGRRCDLCPLSSTKLCSNVDRQLLKKVEKLSKEEISQMNKTIRGDVSKLVDIEDLA